MADNRPKHGTFCWNELVTRDVPAAKKFYSELIGWDFEKSDMSNIEYFVMKIGETMAAGLMAMPAEVAKEVPSHWMAYITVDDIDACVKKVGELGGQVFHGPQEIPNLGKFCILRDPTGAVVSLMEFAKK